MDENNVSEWAYIDVIQAQEADLKAHRQVSALDEIEAKFDNVRAAWMHAVQQKNYARLNAAIESLYWFCRMRSRYEEGEALFKAARESIAPRPGMELHPLWGRLLAREASLSPGETTRASLEKSLAVAQAQSDQAEVAFCLQALGDATTDDGHYDEALTLYERSLMHYRETHDAFNTAAVLYKLAQTHRLLKQPERAITLARESLALSRETGDRFWMASALAHTGIIALYTGNYSEAEGYVQEANAHYRAMGYKPGVAGSNIVLSKLAFLRGDIEKETALKQESQNIAADIGLHRVVQAARYLPQMFISDVEPEGEEESTEQTFTPRMDIPTTIDRYQIKRLLAEGSLGAVYLAYDPDTKRDVAIKVAYPEAMARFVWLREALEREVDALVELRRHPGFPDYYAHGETADFIYIVEEYIDGESIREILEEHDGFLSEQDVIAWGIQLCDALHYIHTLAPPLIFRDVKPANIMLAHMDQGAQRICLVDLGIVNPYQPGQEQAAIGTEGFAAPEQYLGYADPRSDIYELGASLHFLLTRRDPRKEDPFTFHDAPPRAINPAISEDLEAVILKATARHPEDRYQSVEAMKSDLLACL